MKKALLTLALLALPSLAAAADQPILSLSRFSFAAGANQVFYHGNGTQRPSQFEVGIYSAYNLTPHLSLAHSTNYVLDSGEAETRVGVRLRLTVPQ